MTAPDQSTHASMVRGQRRLRLPAGAMATAFLALMIVVFTFMEPNFVAPANIRGILLAASIMLVAACGTSFVILMGSIDLSVGPTVTISGMLAAVLLGKIGFVALLLGPIAGLVVGAINGLLFVRLRIPSIIATLGIGTALSGLVFFLSDGQSVAIQQNAVMDITQGGPFFAVPIVAFYAAAILAACIFLHERSQTGRLIHALGSDERTVTLLGARGARAKFLAFCISGLCAGTAGVLLASRLGIGAAQMGDYLTLDTITAVVVGGISILGGAGSLRTVVIGVLIITVLSSGMNIMTVFPYVQTIIKGAIIVVAVLASSARPQAEDVQ